MARLQERIRFGDGHEGIEVKLTPQGICITGWFDTNTGIGGGFIGWEEFDTIRAKVAKVRKEKSE